MQTFSKREAIRVGWERFKERPWFLIALFVFSSAVSAVLSEVSDALSAPMLLGAIDFIVQALVSVAMVYAFLAVYDQKDIAFSDLFSASRYVVRYIGATLLSIIAIVLGFLLFIIPGIIVALAFSLAVYALVDTDTGPILALRESWRITKGHRLNLLVFFILLGLLNIAGILALGVGVLVTAPISALATVHVYRQLHTGITNGVAQSPFTNALAVFLIGAVVVAAASLIMMEIVYL